MPFWSPGFSHVLASLGRAVVLCEGWLVAAGCSVPGWELHSPTMPPRCPALQLVPRSCHEGDKKALTGEHNASGMLPSSPLVVTTSTPSICHLLTAPAAGLPATLHPPGSWLLCGQLPTRAWPSFLAPGAYEGRASRGHDGVSLATALRGLVTRPTSSQDLTGPAPSAPCSGLGPDGELSGLIYSDSKVGRG